MDETLTCCHQFEDVFIFGKAKNYSCFSVIPSREHTDQGVINTIKAINKWLTDKNLCLRRIKICVFFL